jgi:protein gp37
VAKTTSIEWCDATLNLWWGCTKVSDGCKFCYAEHLSDHRLGKDAWGPKGTRREVKGWRSTLRKISKLAKGEGRRLRVFVQSMSDTFEGPETMGGEASENWALVRRLRRELLVEIGAQPELDFLLLTKRPQNVVAAFAEVYDGGHIPGNVWLGTSVEDQATADERIPHLLRIPAAVRFVSCEPLLGPVNLRKVVAFKAGSDRTEIDSLMGLTSRWGVGASIEVWPPKEPRLHWVIGGGESGPNPRPMHPDWARSLRDQCQAAGVPFLFKQWGEWAPVDGSSGGFDDDPEASRYKHVEWRDGRWSDFFYPIWSDEEDGYFDAHHTMARVGKKKAGRLLDGREWNEFPEVVARG